jgi:eukaryotic-like serine/threonine-protein kinase
VFLRDRDTRRPKTTKSDLPSPSARISAPRAQISADEKEERRSEERGFGDDEAQVDEQQIPDGNPTHASGRYSADEGAADEDELVNEGRIFDEDDVRVVRKRAPYEDGVRLGGKRVFDQGRVSVGKRRVRDEDAAMVNEEDVFDQDGILVNEDETGDVLTQAPAERRRSKAARDLIREGDVLLGNYRIDHVLTEGLVVIATATHLDLRSRAQVTLLSPYFRGFAEANEHLARTVRVVSHMQSEHVCRITDAGALGSGAPFMMVEFVGETDLVDESNTRGPLPIAEAVDYVIQAAEALAEAHSLGIFHGNLTPSNMRIAAGLDGWPTIKLLGFGVTARCAADGLTANRSRRRRPRMPSASALAYLSPEQLRHPKDLDGRVDVWALGAILHELLTGMPLFLAETNPATLAMIAADAAPGVSVFRSDIPRQLESTILRCLEKDRQARFPTMAELVRALQPYASEESNRIVERVVRIVARGPTKPDMRYRSPNALVHVRQCAARSGANSSAANVQPSSQEFRQGRSLTAASVVGVGLLAGIGGAITALLALGANAVRAPAVVAAIAEPRPSLEQRAYAATPVASLVAPAPRGDGLAPPAVSARPIEQLSATPNLLRAGSGAALMRTPKYPLPSRLVAAASKRQEPPAANAPSRGTELFDDIK